MEEGLSWNVFLQNYKSYKEARLIEFNGLDSININFEMILDINEGLNLYTFLLGRKLVFNNDVTIRGSGEENGDDIKEYYISNWIFKGGLTLQFSSSLSLINLTKCTILGNCHYLDNKINKIEFIDSYIGESKFDNRFDKITILNCNFKKITFLKLTSTEYLGTSILLGYDDLENNKITEIGDIFFKNNYKINELNIIGNNKKINSIIFDNIAFRNKDNGYYLRNFSCEQLKFKNFTNNAEIFKIHNVNVSNEFVVNDGDFGKTNFNNLKLKDVFFKGIVLTDCIFNNVLWHNYNFLHKSGDDKEKIDETCINFEMKDIYRQLKFVMDKNGNYTEGNRFYGREMEYYGKCFRKWGWESLLFRFKKFVSNFGNNWISPSELLIGLILLYSLLKLIFTDGIVVVNYNIIDNLSTNGEYLIKEFFINLSPLSSLNKDEILNMAWWFTPILFTYKLLYGIFIFYIGVGLKRHSKR